MNGVAKEFRQAVKVNAADWYEVMAVDDEGDAVTVRYPEEEKMPDFIPGYTDRIDFK